MKDYFRNMFILDNADMHLMIAGRDAGLLQILISSAWSTCLYCVQVNNKINIHVVDRNCINDRLTKYNNLKTYIYILSSRFYNETSYIWLSCWHLYSGLSISTAIYSWTLYFLLSHECEWVTFSAKNVCGPLKCSPSYKLVFGGSAWLTGCVKRCALSTAANPANDVLQARRVYARSERREPRRNRHAYISNVFSAHSDRCAVSG